MDFKRLSQQAKHLFDRRGGSKSLKEDADELRDIARGGGSLSDKAKAAADAIKEPGAREPGAREPGAREPGAREPDAPPPAAPPQPPPSQTP
jgi:general stress protein YciG